MSWCNNTDSCKKYCKKEYENYIEDYDQEDKLVYNRYIPKDDYRYYIILQDLYSFNDCIHNNNKSFWQCMDNSLDNIGSFIESNGIGGYYTPMNYLNLPSRFHPITY